MLTFLAYAYGELLTPQAIVLALLLGVPFLAAKWFGAHRVHGTSDIFYRRLAYIIIAV